MRMRVRTLPEIAATLDGDDQIDGLPFMPEMRSFAGTVHEVRPINRLMVEGTGVRSISDAFIIDALRCDGSAHQGCRRACLLVWKGAWLSSDLHAAAASKDADDEQPVASEARGPCQGDARALMAATTPRSVLDPRQYAADVRSGTRSMLDITSMLTTMMADRLRWQVGKARSRLLGVDKPARNPPLQLRPGDLVQVRSRAEIRRTLDRHQKHHGLHFADGMWQYCGQQLRVLHAVDRFVVEETGRLVEARDTWYLEGATCDGLTFRGCPRNCHWFWRGAWLRPAPANGRA